MADSLEHIQKTKKLYLLIGALLFIFTGVTVAVATVPWLDFGAHGFDAIDAVIGLLIASFKASLVLLIFMHLNHEKKLVYQLLGMGVVFAFVLMWLTGWAFEDPLEYGDGTKAVGTGFYNPPQLNEE